MNHPSAPRYWTMTLILGAHMLVLLAWPERALNPNSVAVRSSDIVFVLETPKRAPSATAPKRLPSAAVHPRFPVISVQPPPAIVAPPPIAFPEQELPATSTSTIAERALRAAGKVDRELRETSLNAAVRNTTIGKTRRELAIAGAYAGGGTRIEELELPDGRRVSKVISGSRSYCVFMESNGLVGGRDVFRDGVKTKVGPCP